MTAVAIEIEVNRKNGRIRLIRVVAADDSGQTINPDGIANQIDDRFREVVVPFHETHVARGHEHVELGAADSLGDGFARSRHGDGVLVGSHHQRGRIDGS